MTAEEGTSDPGILGDRSDHVVEARRRARQMLGGEAHAVAVDDWRRALVSARDAVIVVLIAWFALRGGGAPEATPAILIGLAVGFAFLQAISTARATHVQAQFQAAELDRERREIREDFEGECAEIRALYAAKGFREPLLSQIVETISADDDRLLKVMMEEELGLFLHHLNHPLLVGLWNFTAALLAGLGMACPLLWTSSTAAAWVIPCAGMAGLTLCAVISAWVSGRNVVEQAAASLILAVTASGTAYWLAQWLAAPS